MGVFLQGWKPRQGLGWKFLRRAELSEEQCTSTTRKQLCLYLGVGSGCVGMFMC